jgi:hypothetical protein
MLIDHDRDYFGIDTECCYQRIGKLVDYPAFLFAGKSLSHPDNYYRHSTLTVILELWDERVFIMQVHASRLPEMENQEGIRISVL